MRRFEFHREVDVTGVSGTGIVAEGVLFTDGSAVVQWIAGEHRSTVVWPDTTALDSIKAIHGHDGKTQIVFLDE